MKQQTLDLSMEGILDDAFSSQSGTGEEELLRIASKYSLQLSGAQLRTLTICSMIYNQVPDHPNSKALRGIVEKWLEMKQYHGSNLYVMRALDSIALRRFVNENSVKVNVQKQ